MNKKAYVKEITGDKAVLSVKRECMCAGKDNCNAKCFTLQSDIIEVTTDNKIGAKSGDFVEVEGKTSAILIYAAVVFILPVFTGLLLYFITQVFTKNIILPYIISGAGFILSVVFLYYFLNNIVKGRNDFKITKIL
jgi:sigma-E factor negative regulatory protein RseC